MGLGLHDESTDPNGACDCSCTTCFCCTGGRYAGDGNVAGVRGDADAGDDESGLEGSSSGTGERCAMVVRGDDGLWTKERAGRRCLLTAIRPSWWLKKSSSATLSSKSRTSRNSRSMRPTSRLPKTPVHNAQWTFFKVESLRYCTRVSLG